MLSIDGSFGEGGGQILRSSLALSLVTGQPFHIENIRAGRRKPGLMAQHLASVRAAAEVGAAQVDGGELGSRDVIFQPSCVTGGNFVFSIGTAGSVSLVLQTVLPALITASGPSQLVLEGGTHNEFAPPFEFLQKCFLPIVNSLGPRVTTELERPGFYPAGGGRLRVSIQPAESLSRIDLCERGRVLAMRATAMVSRLPRHIAERELEVIGSTLKIPGKSLQVVEVTNSPGPGNAVTIEIEGEHVTEVIGGFGRRGVRAEQVARAAAREARAYLDADVPVGIHLADQLILPMALAGGGAFVTQPLSVHTTTNIDVVGQFIDVNVEIEQGENRAVRVAFGG